MATQLPPGTADQALFVEALEKLGTPDAWVVMTVKDITPETEITIAYRNVAQSGADDDLRIDDNAVMGVVEGGAWVSRQNLDFILSGR
jgi:hypothetical protein